MKCTNSKLRVIVTYLLLIAVGLPIAWPLLWAVGGSLKTLEEVYAFPPTLLPESPQWDNYVQATSRLPFWRFIANTLAISLPAMVGAVLTSAMAGFAFARLRWRTRELWFWAVLVSLMIPSQVLLIPHFLTFKWLGWVNTYKPLIVPAWLGGGAFNIFLFRQFFRSVPQQLQDAARIDGATHWQCFRYVMLPLAKPVILAVGVLSLFYHWRQFLNPLIYLSDYETYPISLGLRMYQSVQASWTNLLLAAVILSLLPIALVFLCAQRFLVKGLEIHRAEV